MTDPKIWGPHAWNLLHTIANAYPENPNHDAQLNIERFIKTFSELLPCSTCKDDFRKYILKFPVQSKSQKSLVKWMIDAHNHVNKKLGKKLVTYSEAEKLFLQVKKDDICTDCAPPGETNHLAATISNQSPNATTTMYLKIFQFIFFILFLIFLVLFLNAKYKFFSVDLMRFFHKF